MKVIEDRKPVNIDINEFDKTPGPYCMSFEFDNRPLINSIEAFGLTGLPFIVRNRERNLEIVSGYRRILTLKALKWEKVPCIDLSGQGFSECELLLFNLYDNIPTRLFNNVEKGMILNRLMSYFSRDKIIEKFMPLLQVPNTRELDILTEIESFSYDIKKAIANGLISIKAVGLVLKLDKKSASTVLSSMLNINYNFNQQLLYIDYITDISIKEDKDIANIINDPFLENIYNDNGLNNPQKAKKALEYLRKRRFPLLSDSENMFKRQIAKLNLPKGVTIKHSPFFESSDYSLEISFKNGKDLTDKIKILTQKERLELIDDPWKTD